MQQSSPLEIWVRVLLFLFPVGAVSLDHWASGFFILLSFTGIYALFRRRSFSLSRSEKILLWVFAGFFVLTPITGFLSQFEFDFGRQLEDELRFLLAVPLYLLVRRWPDQWLWLLRGGLIGALVLGGQALYEIHVLGMERAAGPYSPNLFGPFAAMLAVWAMLTWQYEPVRWLRWIAIAAFLSAVVAMALSGSRAAYLAFVVMSFVWVVTALRGRWVAIGSGLLLVFVFAIYIGVDAVKYRVDQAVEEGVAFFESDDVASQEGTLEGNVVRLEMWRTALYIIRDNPWAGVGRDNYNDAASLYVSAGLVHPDVTRHAHPHNAYLEAWVSKGILGVMLYVAMLGLPLVLFWRARDDSGAARLGLVHVMGIATVSLVDASVIIKGNFIALMLVVLCVALASMMQRAERRAPRLADH